MKKIAYIIGGFVLGVVVATSGSAFAAQVKSLVGQKVTSEVNVVVDGKQLATKGVIINNTTNVPARALSEAVGGDISISGNTVTITTNGGETVADESNPYSGKTKEELLKTKDNLETHVLGPLKESKTYQEDKLKLAEAANDESAISNIKAEIAGLDSGIEKYSAQLDQVNAALAALQK